MSEERQAQELVEKWVQAHVVPKVVIFLGASGYTPDETVQGMHGKVRLHRTTTGRVYVTCTNKLIVEALTRLFGEKYLVQHTHRSAKSHIVYITPKSTQK